MSPGSAHAPTTASFATSAIVGILLLTGTASTKAPAGRAVNRPLSCRCVTSRPMSWWRDGVLYQIYPRSYADSSGDGVGDLRGIIGRLDHLEWLAVARIWLNPTMPSPNADWGYDVADYCDVHPELG